MILPTDFTDWARSHYRERTFAKDAPIPTRPGLLYLVSQGTVRLTGLAPAYGPVRAGEGGQGAFLGLIGAGQPFEVPAQEGFQFQARAHLEQTSVIWVYWPDLEGNWPDLKGPILESFRHQHQRQLLWLSLLGRKRARDRLLGFLRLLASEGSQSGSLTHAQIGSAIGVSRVTVTRLLGKLKQEGAIPLEGNAPPHDLALALGRGN